MVTFVSAFIDRTLYDPKLTEYRSLDFYLDHGRRFLEQPVPKVVLERHIIEQLGSDLAGFPTTTIIPFEKEELLYWPRREEIHRCTVSSWANPQKDTHDYFMVIWNKAEWARRAAELNPYGTTDFVWIDFGIQYICRQDFGAHIRRMQSRTVPEGKIRLPGCGSFYMPPPQPGDLVWYFCGGYLRAIATPSHASPSSRPRCWRSCCRSRWPPGRSRSGFIWSRDAQSCLIATWPITTIPCWLDFKKNFFIKKN